jgi:hypothetical protein
MLFSLDSLIVRLVSFSFSFSHFSYSANVSLSLLLAHWIFVSTDDFQQCLVDTNSATEVLPNPFLNQIDDDDDDDDDLDIVWI